MKITNDNKPPMFGPSAALDLTTYMSRPAKSFWMTIANNCNTFIVAPSGAGMRFNPVASIGDPSDTDTCLAMLQTGANYTLAPDAYQVARRIALDAAATQLPSVLTLVDAWATDPVLVDFALAVRQAFVPH